MDAGRDAGKTFKITELPAVQMDKWMTRLLGCFAKQDITIFDLTEMSFAELANNIYKIEAEEEKNLLFDELLSSCYLKKEGVRDHSQRHILNINLINKCYHQF